ncbi:hypothetical protein GCM10007063_29160 [Lentibacillus kapialis]|uniref:YetF C-terminal domain-containing protein n=1 Tax=Lentibacillus kapialis TaxID=340214 RepID=A0A917V0F0_9BACI|nr:DUF421 domain-containing protein [Lentibacillus kapialis]GGK04955.1 hypothetical protein GCM10007063_29160 [Lentibacillus kapialis]
MFFFLLKLILLYFVTIIIIRSLGKSAFAQLTAHDLAGIFFVISLATGPVITDNFGYTITGLIVVGLVHIGFSRLMLFNGLDRIFVGKPTIVIKHGKLVRENLKETHFTLSEILSKVREEGHPDISLIDYAIIEPSGGISIIPHQDIAPVTPAQLDIETSYNGLPIAVVIEGRIQHRNLQLINKDEQWLKGELADAGYPDRSHIFYAAVRDDDYSLMVDTGTGNIGDK